MDTQDRKMCSFTDAVPREPLINKESQIPNLNNSLSSCLSFIQPLDMIIVLLQFRKRNKALVGSILGTSLKLITCIHYRHHSVGVKVEPTTLLKIILR